MDQNEPQKPLPPGSFKRGHDPRRVKASRKPGALNKVTRDLKNGILNGAIAHGADGRGKDGLDGFLAYCAKHHTVAYMHLLGKLLPHVVNATGVNAFVGSINVVAVPSASFLSADDAARMRTPLAIDHDTDELMIDNDSNEESINAAQQDR